MACQKSSPTAEKISCQNIGVLSKTEQYCNDYILFVVTIEDSNGKRFCEGVTHRTAFQCPTRLYILTPWCQPIRKHYVFWNIEWSLCANMTRKWYFKTWHFFKLLMIDFFFRVYYTALSSLADPLETFSFLSHNVHLDTLSTKSI